MKPTERYIAARNGTKSTREAQSGLLHATIENIGDHSFIYVSYDGGLHYTLLDWKHDIWAGIKIWLHDIPWPPQDIWDIKSLNDQQLTILYVHPRWSEPDIYVYATYAFKTGKWHLKLK
jgi:hypothetical protein